MPTTSNDPVYMQIPSESNLAKAIVQTVAYVDVFDYPLRPAEVHRYLIGLAVPRQAVDETLANGYLVPRHLERQDGYITLPGRRQIVEMRRQREVVAHRLWPVALHYGRAIAGLPFVRMVAVTGSLAVNNATPDADIDYLIVTSNDRLWLCRALIILIVRLAARREVSLCPNYLLSERALVFPEQNLYTAHELAQMVPLSGQNLYRRIRRLNCWVDRWLPNAGGSPRPVSHLSLEVEPLRPRLQRLLEWGLDSRLGQRLETWEMERKLAKLNRQATAQEAAQKAAQQPGRGTDPAALEVQFSADWCKGHFDGHARHIMNAYHERIHTLGVES